MYIYHNIWYIYIINSTSGLPNSCQTRLHFALPLQAQVKLHQMRKNIFCSEPEGKGNKSSHIQQICCFPGSANAYSACSTYVKDTELWLQYSKRGKMSQSQPPESWERTLNSTSKSRSLEIKISFCKMCYFPPTMWLCVWVTLFSPLRASWHFHCGVKLSSADHSLDFS